MIPCIFRDDEVVVVLGNYPYIVSVDDPRYEAVTEAVDEDDEEGLLNILSSKRKASGMLRGLEDEGIEYSEGTYSYKGNTIAMDLNDYLAAAMDTGGSVTPIVKFIQNLYENPNHDTRMRLFGFIERNKMPLMDDGRFIAFKGVGEDYYDKHSHTVDHTPGRYIPVKDWSDVDTDSTVTCSRGYHACAKEYLDSWYAGSDRIVSVAIDPADVGAIPDDYNQAKLRCRHYAVLADITDKFNAEKSNSALGGDLKVGQTRDMFGSRARDLY
jgi:hypothetical protein